MITVNDLRERCKKIHSNRRKKVECVLESWLKESFIFKNRPWRAVIGNKRCKPIPIHRDILSYRDNTHFLCWPDLPEHEIREILEILGFVIIGAKLSLAVPPLEKGKPLTFAQEWVKRINYNYSLYIRNERMLAEKSYNDIISLLYNAPDKSIRICDGYVLFEGVNISNITGSAHFSRFLTNLLSRNDLEISRRISGESFIVDGIIVKNI